MYLYVFHLFYPNLVGREFICFDRVGRVFYKEFVFKRVGGIYIFLFNRVGIAFYYSEIFILFLIE